MGDRITLKETDHAAIREAMDATLSNLRSETGESFMTYLSPHEREEFDAAHFCLEHQFDAPDYVGEAEKRSRAEIDKVLIAMRVVKPTAVRPVLYLGWEYREGTWELRGFQKGFDIYTAPGEPLGSFSTADVVSLAGMMPRVRRAYLAHGRNSFNRVANALNFFETGYRSNWDAVRFVVFTTVLESLFITSDDGISRQFRERISRLLAQDPGDRQRLEDTCRQIYNTRSAIVHGGQVPGGSGIDELMLQVQDIGRRCVRRVLEDEALFGTLCGSSAALGQFLDQIP